MKQPLEFLLKPINFKFLEVYHLHQNNRYELLIKTLYFNPHLTRDYFNWRNDYSFKEEKLSELIMGELFFRYPFSRELIEELNFVTLENSLSLIHPLLSLENKLTLFHRLPNSKTLNVILPPIIYNEQLHSDDGTPVIEYEDGLKIYANKGQWIPAHYGSIPVQEWNSLWILSERNAQIRQVLIGEIGWEKVYQALLFVSVDQWREYELLFYLKRDLHPEPIQLLKMVCPSTDSIYIIRVPPNVNTAQEGATWINHGIDPSSFAVET